MRHDLKKRYITFKSGMPPTADALFVDDGCNRTWKAYKVYPLRRQFVAFDHRNFIDLVPDRFWRGVDHDLVVHDASFMRCLPQLFDW